MKAVTIASRGSALAMWQARYIRDALVALHPGLKAQIAIVHTKGDRIGQPVGIEEGQTGFFTREIEQSLLSGRADIAVHSLKDLPTAIAEGLSIAAVPTRHDPADVLISNPAGPIEGLPHGATVLTGSLRRQMQLLHRRGDLNIMHIGGNVDTRLRKFHDSEASAIVLAAAGLERLGLMPPSASRLDPREFLPAPGQGALAVQIRRDDRRMFDLVRPLDDPQSHLATSAERAFLGVLGAGCRAPAGAYATFNSDETLDIIGLVGRPDGKVIVQSRLARNTPDVESAQALGRDLARHVLDEGGREIIQALKTTPPQTQTQRKGT